MTRPTRVEISEDALLHNLARIKQYAPNQKVIAMVKANAYGCGLTSVLPSLEGRVDAFGVACLEEAMAIRATGSNTDCILFQGMFALDELPLIVEHQFQVVLHQPHQLQWLLAKPLDKPIGVWIKVNTGMHRLGFYPEEVFDIVSQLQACPWIKKPIGLMTHLACADEPQNPFNAEQLKRFAELHLPHVDFVKSIANSAAIISFPQAHADVVRPGIMLYGVSPFSQQQAQQLDLVPVMRFMSVLSAIRHYPPKVTVGYGATWQTQRASVIGVVAAGYGDGYPRHIPAGMPVWLNGQLVPIVGRVSMDMLTVDLTDCPEVKIGDAVELWGPHLPVEQIAAAAGTIGYELLCQISPRVQRIVTHEQIMDNK